jgi:hypothetical protein
MPTDRPIDPESQAPTVRRGELTTPSSPRLASRTPEPDRAAAGTVGEKDRTADVLT